MVKIECRPRWSGCSVCGSGHLLCASAVVGSGGGAWATSSGVGTPGGQ